MKNKDIPIHQRKENPIINEFISNDFAPYESTVINKDTLNLNHYPVLTISNTSGAAAEFIWQKDIMKKEYFKETMNDIGVAVNHSSDSITVTNGGARQTLIIGFRIQD